jgi:hypothetical protein
LQVFYYAVAVKFNLRNPFCILGLVLLWRGLIFIFTVQPIPANDAAFFDTAMVNWLRHGHYLNPSLSVVFPISGHQLYAAYPPFYQIVLLAWMSLFGTSVVSAIALHLTFFIASAWLVIHIVKTIFPATTNYALIPLLLFGVTFDDRPDGLVHVFGLFALFLTSRSILGRPGWWAVIAVALALLCSLYTSVIPGALYFGVGVVMVGVAWLQRRDYFAFVPFVLAAAMFTVLTWAIAHFEPLWWAGFSENARQTPVLITGFRVPHLLEIIKLIRTTPVFLLALVCLPLVFARRKQIFDRPVPWLALVVGVFVTGWGLLFSDMTLLAANYVGYVLFIQVLLAAGILALSENFSPGVRRGVQVVLIGCVVLVSIRAVGMTTWGAACAWQNSYWRTHETLRTEFAPFAETNTPVIISSAYMYTALEANVQNPVHSDWYFDRANWTNNADINGLVALRPAKLVLVQFDYYRAFVPLLAQLRQRPGLVSIQVRDLSKIRTPDSIPSLERVVQHISWAPVIVDLDWK